MEFSLSGNALKTFARSVTCLARIGNELVIQASPSQVFHILPLLHSSFHFPSESASLDHFHQRFSHPSHMTELSVRI